MKIGLATATLEFLSAAAEGAERYSPAGNTIEAADIVNRLPRLLAFLRLWIDSLQPIEPLSRRIAVFVDQRHWEHVLEMSRPIALSFAPKMYRVPMRDREVGPVDFELRQLYEWCERNMPEPRYAISALLCFFLLGYFD